MSSDDVEDEIRSSMELVLQNNSDLIKARTSKRYTPRRTGKSLGPDNNYEATDSEMAILALMSTPAKALAVKEIYSFICYYFPARTENKTWMACIRHAICQRVTVFAKFDRKSIRIKHATWCIRPAIREKIQVQLAKGSSLLHSIRIATSTRVNPDADARFSSTTDPVPYFMQRNPSSILAVPSAYERFSKKGVITMHPVDVKQPLPTLSFQQSSTIVANCSKSNARLPSIKISSNVRLTPAQKEARPLPVNYTVKNSSNSEREMRPVYSTQSDMQRRASIHVVTHPSKMVSSHLPPSQRPLVSPRAVALHRQLMSSHRPVVASNGRIISSRPPVVASPWPLNPSEKPLVASQRDSQRRFVATRPVVSYGPLIQSHQPAISSRSSPNIAKVNPVGGIVKTEPSSSISRTIVESNLILQSATSSLAARQSNCTILYAPRPSVDANTVTSSRIPEDPVAIASGCGATGIKATDKELGLLALMSTPASALYMNQIYNYISYYFPERRAQESWQASIRHALGDKSAFGKVVQMKPAGSLYRTQNMWFIEPDLREKINHALAKGSSLLHAIRDGRRNIYEVIKVDLHLASSASESLPYYLQRKPSSILAPPCAYKDLNKPGVNTIDRKTNSNPSTSSSSSSSLMDEQTCEYALHSMDYEVHYEVNRDAAVKEEVVDPTYETMQYGANGDSAVKEEVVEPTDESMQYEANGEAVVKEEVDDYDYDIKQDPDYLGQLEIGDTMQGWKEEEQSISNTQ